MAAIEQYGCNREILRRFTAIIWMWEVNDSCSREVAEVHSNVVAKERWLD
jgi:hypothetical protein